MLILSVPVIIVNCNKLFILIIDKWLTDHCYPRTCRRIIPAFV